MLILLIIFYYVVFLAYFQNDEESDNEEQWKRRKIKQPKLQSISTGLTESKISKDYPCKNFNPSNLFKTLPPAPTTLPTNSLAPSQTSVIISVDEKKQKIQFQDKVVKIKKLEKLDGLAIKNIPIKKVLMEKSNLAPESNKSNELIPAKNAPETKLSEVTKSAIIISKISKDNSNKIIPIKNTFFNEVPKGKSIQVVPNLNSKTSLTKNFIFTSQDKCAPGKISPKEKSFDVIKAKSISLKSMETAKGKGNLVEIIEKCESIIAKNAPKSGPKTSSDKKDNFNVKQKSAEVFILEKSPPKLILKSKSNLKKSFNNLSKSLSQLSFKKRTKFKSHFGLKLSANFKK